MKNCHCFKIESLGRKKIMFQKFRVYPIFIKISRIVSEKRVWMRAYFPQGFIQSRLSLRVHVALKQHSNNRKNLKRYADKFYKHDKVEMKSNCVIISLSRSSVTKNGTKRQKKAGQRFLIPDILIHKTL